MANQKIRSGADRPALVVGLLLLAVAGAGGAATPASQTIVSNYGVGPTAMPYVVGRRARPARPRASLRRLPRRAARARDGRPAARCCWIVGGLVGFIACVALGGGFVIATALLFAFTARGFGRRGARWSIAPSASSWGSSIFLVFSKLLTLLLPAGPLERLLV